MNPEKTNHHSNELTQAELDKLFNIYRGLNNGRLELDQLGCDYCQQLETELSRRSPRPNQVRDLISDIETQEQLVANNEKTMQTYEFKLNKDVDDSLLYNNSHDDLLVKSSVLYRYRLDHLKQATHNQDIAQPFAESVLRYFNSIDELELGSDSQAELERLNKSRIQAHNSMIKQLNQLNNLCLEHQLTPLTYRNFVTSSRANNYNNNLQQAHDRITVSTYVRKILETDLVLDAKDELPTTKSSKHFKKQAVHLLFS